MEDKQKIRFDVNFATSTTNNLLYCIENIGLSVVSMLHRQFYIDTYMKRYNISGFCNTINIFASSLRECSYCEQNITDECIVKSLNDSLKMPVNNLLQFNKIICDLYVYTSNNKFEDDTVFLNILELLNNIDKLENFVDEQKCIEIFMDNEKAKILIDFCNSLKLEEA